MRFNTDIRHTNGVRFKLHAPNQSELHHACFAVVSLLITGFSFSVSADEIAVGKPAPNFTVTNVKGETVKLSDWVGKKQLVVVFSRAHWCPFCMRQLKEISKSYEQIQKHGGEVIVVFREERDGSEGLKKSQQASGAEFPLLLDLGKKQTEDYSTDGFTTYVIGKDGKVKAILGGTKKDRPTVKEILKALHE